MIHVYSAVVFSIYLITLFYAVSNFFSSQNERRNGMRIAIEAYSMMVIVNVLLYGILQINLLDEMDFSAHIFTYNSLYHLINALTHLASVIAVRVWLGVMGVRISEEKVSLFPKKAKQTHRKETRH